MYTIEISMEGEAGTVAGNRNTLAKAIKAARLLASQAADGVSITVYDKHETWWSNEGDWRNAEPGPLAVERMESEA